MAIPWILANYMGGLPHNFYGCLFMNCMIVVATEISIFSLLAIGIERFFAELTTRQLKRLAVDSVTQLVDTITRYINRRNEDPKPFVWTASAKSIIAKVNKAKETLATHH